MPIKRKHSRVKVDLPAKLHPLSQKEAFDCNIVNISLGGMFVQTETELPAVRTENNPSPYLDFQIIFDDNSLALKGIGKVVWNAGSAQPGEEPSKPGVGIRFTKLDPQLGQLIQQIVDRSLAYRGRPNPYLKAQVREEVGWEEVFGVIVHAIELARLPKQADKNAIYAKIGKLKEELFDGKTVRLLNLFTFLLSQRELRFEDAALPIIIIYLIQSCLPIAFQLPEMVEKHEGFSRLLMLADKRINGHGD